jgi:Tfp pilus assembly protein PilN
MGEFNLNLSTRPFPAYQVKTLLLTAALIALIAISIWQSVGFRQYSEMSNRIRGQVQAAQVQSEALGRRLTQSEARLNRPEAAAKLSEIEFLNDIITRRNFSWAQMFANLERVMPDNVHLVSLAPEISKNGVHLSMELNGRSIDDIKELIVALQASPLFGTVDVSYDTKKQLQTVPAPPSGESTDIQAAIKVTYHPERGGQ